MDWEQLGIKPRYFILDNAGDPVPAVDCVTWAIWYENTDRRRLALTKVGPVTVSTVFLGLDHAFGRGPPVLWETCCFGAPDGSDHMQRYTSRDNAVRGHNDVCAEIRELLQELRP